MSTMQWKFLRRWIVTTVARIPVKTERPVSTPKLITTATALKGGEAKTAASHALTAYSRHVTVRNGEPLLLLTDQSNNTYT